MANVFDYLDWRGDLSFSQSPFCEVDNLILSLLAYPDFSGISLEGDTVGLPLSKITPLYFQRHPRTDGALGFLLPDEIQDLLLRAAATRRFGSVRLWGHRNKVDREREMQFSATTFTLGNGISFVAFRGTDDTIIGWKEDFNMSVSFPVPAQEEARAYLEYVAAHTDDMLMTGGHSKGGNLSVYAAAFCSPETRSRIRTVWCNDGPGFLPELLAEPGVQAVRGRIRALMPRSGVVGVLLTNNWETTYVESSALGALQHNGLTWQVLGPAFQRAEGPSRSSRHADRTFRSLLLEMDTPHRRLVIDEVFSLGPELGVDTLTELACTVSRRQLLRALSEKLTGIDKDTRERVFRALRAAFRAEEDEENMGEDP